MIGIFTKPLAAVFLCMVFCRKKSKNFKGLSCFGKHGLQWNRKNWHTIRYSKEAVWNVVTKQNHLI